MPTLKRKTRLGAGDLILNSPLEEPTHYGDYVRAGVLFDPNAGRRVAEANPLLTKSYRKGFEVEPA